MLPGFGKCVSVLRSTQGWARRSWTQQRQRTASAGPRTPVRAGRHRQSVRTPEPSLRPSELLRTYARE